MTREEMEKRASEMSLEDLEEVRFYMDMVDRWDEWDREWVRVLNLEIANRKNNK